MAIELIPSRKIWGEIQKEVLLDQFSRTTAAMLSRVYLQLGHLAASYLKDTLSYGLVREFFQPLASSRILEFDRLSLINTTRFNEEKRSMGNSN